MYNLGPRYGGSLFRRDNLSLSNGEASLMCQDSPHPYGLFLALQSVGRATKLPRLRAALTSMRRELPIPLQLQFELKFWLWFRFELWLWLQFRFRFRFWFEWRFQLQSEGSQRRERSVEKRVGKRRETGSTYMCWGWRIRTRLRARWTFIAGSPPKGLEVRGDLHHEIKVALERYDKRLIPKFDRELKNSVVDKGLNKGAR
ncbi:hypothetical protein B0H10DRAFT_1950759 [Mycena sp. CBHHK59/15]|nr:hypothetical protein B0H10DRAFT_1950759 [Mycena sp. CBHHK59/15]